MRKGEWGMGEEVEDRKDRRFDLHRENGKDNRTPD
jgi:hypothetical protein